MNSFIPRAALVAGIALLAPGIALSQTAEPADAGIVRNEATLDERLEDPSLKLLPEYEDEVEIYEDTEGRRYVRADRFDRMTAEQGTTADDDTYLVFIDAAGERYYRLDENNEPMLASAAGGAAGGSAGGSDTVTVATDNGTVELGSQAIGEIQEALNEKGLDAGNVDGLYGESTRAAVRNFQQEQGLDATGKLNRKTIQALGLDLQKLGNRGQDGQQASTDSASG